MKVETNEKPFEIDLLKDFINSHRSSIGDLLDVGCHGTAQTYAPWLHLNAHLDYEGIDIIDDAETATYLANYFVGNVVEEMDGSELYDTVISISSLEHSGIGSYKVKNWREERRAVLKKVIDLSKKYTFITSPYGNEKFIEGQYANFTFEDLQYVAELTKDYKLKVGLHFLEWPPVPCIVSIEVDKT